MFCELIASTHVLWVGNLYEGNFGERLSKKINTSPREVEDSLDSGEEIKIIDVEYFVDNRDEEPRSAMICYQIVKKPINLND